VTSVHPRRPRVDREDAEPPQIARGEERVTRPPRLGSERRVSAHDVDARPGRLADPDSAARARVVVWRRPDRVSRDHAAARITQDPAELSADSSAHTLLKELDMRLRLRSLQVRVCFLSIRHFRVFGFNLSRRTLSVSDPVRPRHSALFAAVTKPSLSPACRSHLQRQGNEPPLRAALAGALPMPMPASTVRTSPIRMVRRTASTSRMAERTPPRNPSTTTRFARRLGRPRNRPCRPGGRAGRGRSRRRWRYRRAGRRRTQ
jgi:hypothetical protein